MSIGILCFSKNRPLQLDACLSSIRRFCGFDLPTTVLYTCDQGFAQAYEYLKQEHGTIKFSEEQDFRKQLLEWLERLDQHYVMFCCDDVFFKLPWQPDRIVRYLAGREQLMAFSLRLGKEISYCHPLNLPSPAPDFIETDPFLLWNWRKAKGPDWKMPLELNCTVIPKDVLGSILSELDQRGMDWAHPNRLEAQAAKVVQLVEGLDLMASYPRARAHCLAINRVQKECGFPVYHDGSFSTRKLLAAFESGLRLDFEQYRDRTYDRVHIGELIFRKAQKTREVLP